MICFGGWERGDEVGPSSSVLSSSAVSNDAIATVGLVDSLGLAET